MSDDQQKEYEVRLTHRAALEYRIMSIEDAAENGTEIELLAAIRTEIARQVSAGVSPRDLASLSKRLIELNRDIEAAEENEIEGGGVLEGEPDEPLDPTTL